MTRSSRTRRLGLATLALASLALGACGSESGRADDPSPEDPITTTTASTTDTAVTAATPVWAPDGSAPPVVLDSPGDGETITVTVGDRVQLPPSPDGMGGIVFDHHDDNDERLESLVPYGDTRTFLAIAPGEIAVQDTVYDPERSCVPPQPVATFTLEITDGPRPDIGEPVEITTDDEGTTIELVPGQTLAYDPELKLSVEKADDSGETEIVTYDGRALRPGTVEVSLSTVASPDSSDQWVSFTVVVTEPGGTDTTAGSPSTLRSTGAAPQVVAAPAAPTARSCGS